MPKNKWTTDVPNNHQDFLPDKLPWQLTTEELKHYCGTYEIELLNWRAIQPVHRRTIEWFMLSHRVISGGQIKNLQGIDYIVGNWKVYKPEEFRQIMIKEHMRRELVDRRNYASAKERESLSNIETAPIVNIQPDPFDF